MLVFDIDDTLIPFISVLFKNDMPLKFKMNDCEYDRMKKKWNYYREQIAEKFDLESWISKLSKFVNDPVDKIIIISKVAPSFKLLFEYLKPILSSTFDVSAVTYVNEKHFYDNLRDMAFSIDLWFDDSPSRLGIAIEYGIPTVQIIQPWNERYKLSLLSCKMETSTVLFDSDDLSC